MGAVTPRKVVITGAAGLLGWHAAARLHAANCMARYRGESEPYLLTLLHHTAFADDGERDDAVKGADAILHFAGVNRGDDAEVEAANPSIARQLADSMRRTGTNAHIVYANSTHAEHNTPYGRSKRRAGEILEDAASGFTNLVLPHIFGECARPYYNNVTATLIEQIWSGDEPSINPEGRVSLLHAGAAAQIAIDCGLKGHRGKMVPAGREMSIIALYEKLVAFHISYATNIFPDLTDPFDLALFNSYRTGGYPKHYPKPLKLNSDVRGGLFESSKSLAGSQTFLSTTRPGQRRGDHFHTDLVERFLVVSGKAVIRIRKVLTDTIHCFEVSGDAPMAIDMPPLHTHHIENDSDGEVVTFFWAHRLFDPANPDTFADPVIEKAA